jgi:hypothetical protein
LLGGQLQPCGDQAVTNGAARAAAPLGLVGLLRRSAGRHGGSITKKWTVSTSVVNVDSVH